MTDLYSWSNFKSLSGDLIVSAGKNSRPIFRGHASDEWSLETTLERSAHRESIMEYYHLILRVKSEVQAFTGLIWPDHPEIPDLQDMIGLDYDTFSRFLMKGMPHYAYMAYLRHHGFPSPLLDWSSSPYVAAYFAFAAPVPFGCNVAIFAYRERDDGGLKIGGMDEPAIHQLGPYVAGPKRHFSQRSRYTVCSHWNSGSPSFWSHDEVCQPFDPKAEFQQDIIYKFTIPGDERDNVLNELAEYNLNAFTLFGSEESLMQSISQREE
jgi:hypothetical protein